MLSRACLFASAVAALFACASPSHAQTISGRASVIDGETLEVRGQRVHLAGIEAPADDHVCARTDDNYWRCGPRAVNALDELLAEGTVSCITRERDGAGRLDATCSVGPVDLSLWLLRNGLAQTSAANGKYRQAEDEARVARRGIWSER